VLLRRAVLQVCGRLSWGVADQVLSSASNFLVSVYIARTLGARSYGAFGLAFITYSFALNASRGLGTDPLLVRFSGTDVRSWREAVAKCTGTAVGAGAALGLCSLVAGLLLGGPTGAAFLALAITLPGLLLQDSWRYSFFAIGRGGSAMLNDGTAAVALVAALAVLRALGDVSVFWSVLAWGGAALVGALIGPLQARVVPRPEQARQWLSAHRDLGWRYLAEGTSNSAATQLRSYGVGLLVGLAAVGYLQAATTLMGPFTVVFFGMGLVALPEAARALRRSPRDMVVFCILLSVGLAVLAMAWGAALLIALPRGLGDWLLGSVWKPTEPLILPMTLSMVGGGLSTGAGMALHALGSAKRSLRAMTAWSATYVICSLVGAWWAGALGAARGLALAGLVGVMLLWRELYVALRERREAGTFTAAEPGWSTA